MIVYMTSSLTLPTERRLPEQVISVHMLASQLTEMLGRSGQGRTASYGACLVFPKPPSIPERMKP